MREMWQENCLQRSKEMAWKANLADEDTNRYKSMKYEWTKGHTSTSDHYRWG
jgi:hypothetical protein